MSKLKWLIGFGVTAMMFSSCLVEQTYYFKKDLSGTYNFKVDITAMEEFDQSDSIPADSAFTAEDIKAFKDYYSAQEGISNVDAAYTDGVINASFDFVSPELLNKANAPSEELDEGEPEKFSVFVCTPVKNGMLIEVNRDFMNEEGTETTQEDIDAMEGMLTLNGYFRFESEIKAIKSEVGAWDQASNTVTINVKFSDVYNKDMDMKTLVTFR
ncbi:MAG: hypothetical protein SGI87_05325 [Flavobacteriales bacterium]|nr:hypothetical protein [Flavobacteriales bacterium]